MKNGQLKAAYNLQIATENQFVLHYDVFSNPTDNKTLLSLLETYPHDVKTVVADAGYGSEENLLRLDEKEVNHIKKLEFRYWKSLAFLWSKTILSQALFIYKNFTHFS